MTIASTTTPPAKADQIAVKSNPNLSRGNPMGVQGIDHVEFYVDDAESWSKKHEFVLGMRRRFRGDASTGRDGRNSIVVGQGRINFIFTEAAGDGTWADKVRDHHAKHGNGVKDVCFKVADVEKAIKHTEKVGATTLVQPHNEGGFHHAAIATYGDTQHSLIHREDDTEFGPGFVRVDHA
ncbi:MAG: VOC family protein, partial [Pseudomonadota bacterium]